MPAAVCKEVDARISWRLILFYTTDEQSIVGSSVCGTEMIENNRLQERRRARVAWWLVRFTRDSLATFLTQTRPPEAKLHRRHRHRHKL